MDNLVSIVIPCHNAEGWVGEAVRSALGQSWRAVEVIVVDDGSTDGSRGVLESFGGQIRWESGPNRGGAAARNRGLELARGEWVQFLDADDLLLADCIESKLAAAGEPGVVPCCGYEFLDFVPREDDGGGPAFWLLTEHDLDTILAKGPPMTEGPLHARQHLLQVGGFRAVMPCAQDFDLHLRLAAVLGLRFKSIGRAGVRVRVLGSSVSRNAGWQMHHWIAESLLHAAGLLEEHGRMTEDRRVVIAQRVTRLARKVTHLGRPEEGARLARGARRLSPRWHESAYRHPLAAAIARGCGFRFYEALLRRLRGRPVAR